MEKQEITLVVGLQPGLDVRQWADRLSDRLMEDQRVLAVEWYIGRLIGEVEG